LEAAIWNELAAEALAVIRKTNPARAVIIGSTNWNGIDALPLLDLPDDPHVIVTFHYYQPFEFTHQGAEWNSRSEPWLGTEWPEDPLDPRLIELDFERAANWAEQQGVPLLLGEFGAYRRADIDSRVRWTTHVARAAEAQGFAWAYWEFGSGFGAYDRAEGAWRSGLLGALIPDGR
jgi:endoglucanase